MMNIQGMQGLAVLAFLWALFTAILWLVIGWRAMRAHEKIADLLEWIARQQNQTREPFTGNRDDD